MDATLSTPPPPRSTIAGHEAAGEVDHRLDVEADHAHLRLGVALVDRAGRRPTGVVHQHVRREAERDDPVEQAGPVVGVDEVGDEHLDSHAERSQLLARADRGAHGAEPRA